MEENVQIQTIVNKLNNKMPFGLFEPNMNCYFRDGTEVRYADLWKAVRIIYKMDEGKPDKSLFQLFPDSFFG